MLGKILLALTLAQAQTNQANGVIHGQILIPSAHVSERILVIVQRADGPIAARVYSDTLGNYDARGLRGPARMIVGRTSRATLIFRSSPASACWMSAAAGFLSPLRHISWIAISSQPRIETPLW